MKASRETPLRIHVFTADEDDAAKGIRRGDVTRILVNPPPKLKK